MKKRFIAYAMLPLLLLCTPIIYAADLQDGFLGLKWRTKISELTGYSKLRENGDISYYRNLNKVYTISNIRIPKVIYGFYTDRLFAVYLLIESPDAFGKIRDYMISQYGDPKETLTMKNEQTVYNWKYGTVKIKLKRYEKVGNMKLAFYYMPLSNKVNEAQQEQFLDKSYQFFPIEKDKVPEWIPLLRF